MSRVRRLPYAFSLALLAALAAGCGIAAPAGERISAAPAGAPDQPSSLQQRFVSIVRAVSPAVVHVRIGAPNVFLSASDPDDRTGPVRLETRGARSA